MNPVETETDEVEVAPEPEEASGKDESTSVIKHVAAHSKPEVDPYLSAEKHEKWRLPIKDLIEKTWGDLRGKRILILEDLGLHEWEMYEAMGSEQHLLTIVQENKVKAAAIQKMLPHAKVIHGKLEDWALDRMRKRLAAQASHTGLAYPRGGKKLIHMMRQGLDKRQGLSFRPDVFSWLLRDPDYQRHQAAILTFLKDPTVVFNVPVDYPALFDDPDEIEAFDLISLDTTAVFRTELPFIQMLFRLGLVTPDAILATNFMAKREGRPARNVYKEALRFAQKIEAGNNDDWDKLMDSNLRLQREATSLMLEHVVSAGGRRCELYNPTGEIFKALLKDISGQSEASIRNAKGAAHFAIEGANLVFNQPHKLGCDPAMSSEEFLVRLRASLFKNMHYYLLTRRCHQVFGPFFRRMDPGQLQKGLGQGWNQQISFTDAAIRPKDGRRLYGGQAHHQAVGASTHALCDIVSNHSMEAYLAQSHSTSGYKGANGTPMRADFMHIQRINHSIGMDAVVGDTLRAAFVRGRIGGGKRRILKEADLPQIIGRFFVAKREAYARRRVFLDGLLTAAREAQS